MINSEMTKMRRSKIKKKKMSIIKKKTMPKMKMKRRMKKKKRMSQKKIRVGLDSTNPRLIWLIYFSREAINF